MIFWLQAGVESSFQINTVIRVGEVTNFIKFDEMSWRFAFFAFEERTSIQYNAEN